MWALTELVDSVRVGTPVQQEGDAPLVGIAAGMVEGPHPSVPESFHARLFVQQVRRDIFVPIPANNIYQVYYIYITYIYVMDRYVTIKMFPG